MDEQTSTSASPLNNESRRRRFEDSGKRVCREARAFGNALQEAIVDLEGTLREQLEQRPYVTLATAAGLGYVLGGGLASRFSKVLLNLGTRLAVAVMLRELTGEIGAHTV